MHMPIEYLTSSATLRLFYIDLAQQLCIYTPQLYLICQVFIHIKDTEVLKDVFA